MDKDTLLALASRFETDACLLLEKFYQGIDGGHRLEGNPVGTATQYFDAGDRLRKVAFRIE
jgi:hypothetical protein